MTPTRVFSLLDKICFTFNRAKITDQNRLEHYADKLAGFDDNAYDYILAQFELLEKFPEALLKSLLRMYSDWIKLNPVFYTQSECVTCNGKGMLNVLYFNIKLSQPYEYIGRCSFCDNWRGACGENVKPVRLAHLASSKPANERFTDAEWVACAESQSPTEEDI